MSGVHVSKELSPCFSFYAADYLSDINVQCMTLEEEGAYVRLMAYCWREGSIPKDPEKLELLAKGSQCYRNVIALFDYPCPDATRLMHPRLELERKKQADNRRKKSESGKKGNAKRWKSKHSGRIAARSQRDNSAIANASQNIASLSPSPSLSPVPDVSIPKPLENAVSSSSEPSKSSRPPDGAYELFASLYLLILGGPYVRSNGDFVRLAALRKACKIGTTEIPTNWETACRHYLETPQGKHTLCDLSSRFGEFVRVSHDRFGKPIDAPAKPNITVDDIRRRAQQANLELSGGKHGEQ
jgi:uncharacterized protein YdaU (DUF1376 family)